MPSTAPRGTVVFPILGALAVGLLCALPARPQLAPWFIATLVVNVVVSFVTAARVTAVAAAFRQIAPVVGTAQRLEVLPDDVRRLRRLKSVSRWISGDPLMLPLTPASPAVLLNDVIQVFYTYLNLGFLLDGNGAYSAPETCALTARPCCALPRRSGKSTQRSAYARFAGNDVTG